MANMYCTIKVSHVTIIHTHKPHTATKLKIMRTCQVSVSNIDLKNRASPSFQQNIIQRILSLLVHYSLINEWLPVI